MIVLSTSTWHDVNILCNIRLNYNSPSTAHKIKKWEKEIVSMLYFFKIGDCFLKIEIKQAALFHSNLFLDEVPSLKGGKQVESTIEVMWYVMRDVHVIVMCLSSECKYCRVICSILFTSLTRASRLTTYQLLSALNQLVQRRVSFICFPSFQLGSFMLSQG